MAIALFKPRGDRTHRYRDGGAGGHPFGWMRRQWVSLIYQKAGGSWDDGCMPDRSRNRPLDLNALTASIVSNATDENPPTTVKTRQRSRWAAAAD